MLYNKGIDDEGVGKSRPGIIFDEDHEEAKTDEHHDIDILVHGIIRFVVASTYIGIHLNKDSVKNHQDNLDDDCVNGKDDLVPFL